ncbi:TPA: hypothetical protein N0F65_005417 [Lagenidium giganteum]|uniref:Uncharacterized protein n=1 Tax=Lagenidium giganteum TaxID=4803 RepID=A0AAV2YX34_9STRA|nr:TPA: hypothetical protein N0F65_005417 [Lagenidium giganteum]
MEVQYIDDNSPQAVYVDYAYYAIPLTEPKDPINETRITLHDYQRLTSIVRPAKAYIAPKLYWKKNI